MLTEQEWRPQVATVSDVVTALSSLRLKLKRGDMFTAREVAEELGATDDKTATEVARVLSNLPTVRSKTIGAGVLPDGLWEFA